MTDHDAATMENIFASLRNLAGEPALQRSYEHQNLAIANTTPAPAQAKIADLLRDVDLLEGAAGGVSEAAPLKVSLPKATAQKQDR